MPGVCRHSLTIVRKIGNWLTGNQAPDASTHSQTLQAISQMRLGESKRVVYTCKQKTFKNSPSSRCWHSPSSHRWPGDSRRHKSHRAVRSELPHCLRHACPRTWLAYRHSSIHRALDGGMPEQFLLDFDVGRHSTQQARVGMAKRVPANLADADTHGGGFDVPSQNALLPAWLPLAVRKYPVAWFSVQAPLPVCPEGIGQTWIPGSTGRGSREASVFVSPTRPWTTLRLTSSVRSHQLKSPHCKPMISLARRPRQAAIRTIVR
jgi:hypothetical protein